MKLRIAMIHFGFALTGVVTTMLGPLLPLLASQWKLNDAQAGRLFTTQFVSAVIGSLIASRVLSRWGAAWTVTIGMVLIAAGIGEVGAHNMLVGLLGICFFGLGLGFAIPATNLLVAEVVPEQRVAALNLLNFSWTAGALAGPLIIASVQRSLGFRMFLILLAVTFVVISVFELVTMPKGISAEARFRVGKLASHKRMFFAGLTCIFLMLYVGVENGFSGWLSTLTSRFHQTSVNKTALIQTSFWGAILLGRLVAPLFIRFTTSSGFILAGLGTSAAGILVTILSRGLVTLEAGVLLCGFGLAALFPTVIAIFTEWYGIDGAGSIVLGVCGFGGATIPWLVGVIAQHSQSLRIGFIVNLACVLVAFLVFWRIQDIVKSQASHIHNEAKSL